MHAKKFQRSARANRTSAYAPVPSTRATWLRSAFDVAVIWVALLTVNESAAVPANLTAVAPEKFVPVMVTLVPPAAGPIFGATSVTVAAET